MSCRAFARGSRWLFCLLAVLVFHAGLAHALEIRETRWGFDGTAFPGRLVPLSVLVVNQAATAFDGALRLEQNGGLVGYVGTPLAQPIYLAPFAARWVQFYPYVGDAQGDGGEWTLRWGESPATQRAVDGPKLGPPARVRLVEGDGNSAFAARPPENQPSWRTFPEALFPTTAAGTDGLDSVVLDHAPSRWEPARRQALVDWLRRGGTVHLYPNQNAGGGGRLPEFSAELAVLNSPLPRLRVGAGTVVRHEASTGAEDGLPPAPELQENKQGGSNNLEPTFFRALASLTRPDVNWPLLYGFSVLYLLALGPGHYFLFGKRRDYRLTLLVFALGVTLFSALFAVIGRRGYGESNQIWTLTLARPLGEGRCDLTQWTSAFMTSGDTYVFTQPGAASGGLFSSAETSERIPGIVVQNGQESAFRAEIPLYSARPFTHRAVVAAKAGEEDGGLRLRQLELDSEGKLKHVEIEAAPAIMTEGKFVRGWLRHSGTMYLLRRQTVGDGRTLEWDLEGKTETEETFFSSQTLSAAMNVSGPAAVRSRAARQSNLGQTTGEDTLADLLPLLMSRALGGTNHLRYNVPSPAPSGSNEVEVFICIRGVPPSFRLAEAHGPLAETGLTLYQQRLFLADAPLRR